MIGIIIPTYRPTMALVSLINQIAKILDTYHIYIVDDSENREAHEFIKRNCLSLNLPITCIELKQNTGQQNAVLCGIRQALPYCNTFITIDDDGQNDAVLIPQLLSSLPPVNGIAYAKPSYSQKLWRKMGSICRNALFSLALHTPKGVFVSSYRAFTYDIAQQISSWQGEFFYFSAVAMALRPQPVAISFSYALIPRKEGKSGYTFKKLAALYCKILWHYGICKSQKYLKEPYIVERIINKL